MKKHLDSEGRRTTGRTTKGKGESQRNKKEIKRSALTWRFFLIFLKNYSKFGLNQLLKLHCANYLTLSMYLHYLVRIMAI